MRTGYAIPGVTVQSFDNQVTTYATLKGSLGVVSGHPFLADPIDGGIIIADVGRPGVPVELNGYSKGRTSFDGKMALTGAVSGAQQRIAIDAEHMSIDVVPSATDGLATVRNGGAAVVKFGVQSSSSSALLNVTVDGAPPPLGSILIARSSTVPISREGRAYLPSLARRGADRRDCRRQAMSDRNAFRRTRWRRTQDWHLRVPPDKPVNTLMHRAAKALCRNATILIATLLVLLSFSVSRSANAQVACNANGPSLSFGTINPNSGFPYTTSGTIAVSCTNSTDSANTVTSCVSIGTGSGGTSPTNRTLSAGAATIPMQITGGNGHPGQIGDGTSYPMDGPFFVTVGAFQTTAFSVPIVITIPQPSTPPKGGSYTSSFNGADALLSYNATSTTCTDFAGTYITTQAYFSVSATVASQCTVAATSLAFPTGATLTAPVDATATITVTCSSNIPVTVALDNGATGTGPTARKMTSGPNAITYGIYLDVARSSPWGSTAGTNTASLNGSGSLTAYGRVPAQNSPKPGSYSDVVNITITY